jgi:hypothetical protein
MCNFSPHASLLMKLNRVYPKEQFILLSFYGVLLNVMLCCTYMKRINNPRSQVCMLYPDDGTF